MFGRAPRDIALESQKSDKPGFEPERQGQGPYEVYSDDNYDKEGNSQSHVGTYSSIEEAVQCCEEIVGKSVKGSTTYCNTPEDIVRNWKFGGAIAFIRGSGAFSPEAYAEQVAREICRDLHNFNQD